jgi:hypothetical protein
VRVTFRSWPLAVIGGGLLGLAAVEGCNFYGYLLGGLFLLFGLTPTFTHPVPKRNTLRR